MPKTYGTIVGRIGIIFLLTGIVITVLRQLRSGATLSRLNGTLATYIGVGLMVVGAILFVIFVITFLTKDKKQN